MQKKQKKERNKAKKRKLWHKKAVQSLLLRRPDKTLLGNLEGAGALH